MPSDHADYQLILDTAKELGVQMSWLIKPLEHRDARSCDGRARLIRTLHSRLWSVPDLVDRLPISERCIRYILNGQNKWQA